MLRSMSRVATPTDTAIIEAMNDWIKEELFLDFGLGSLRRFLNFLISMSITIIAIIASGQPEIPGTQRWQCGNYRKHDLEGAKAIAADMTAVLADWPIK